MKISLLHNLNDKHSCKCSVKNVCPFLLIFSAGYNIDTWLQALKYNKNGECHLYFKVSACHRLDFFVQYTYHCTFSEEMHYYLLVCFYDAVRCACSHVVGVYRYGVEG